MNNVSLPVNRIYKDRLYKMIFNDKSELLKLYIAINGTHYDDPAMLTITTFGNCLLNCVSQWHFSRIGTNASNIFGVITKGMTGIH